MPEREDLQVLINDLKKEIVKNEIISEKIKSLLLYHVVKASFPGQENTRQLVIDSFTMVPEFLISSIYTHIRIKLFNEQLSDVQAYMQITCSSPGNDVKLSEWLDTLNEASSKNFGHSTRKKLVMPVIDSNLDTSIDLAEAGIEKNLGERQVDKIITNEVVSSSASRSEGWLNSLCKKFLKFFTEDVRKFLLKQNQPIFSWVHAKNSIGNGSIIIDQCISGVRYGNGYKEGITCFTKNMQVLIFPKNSNAKIAALEDKYSKQLFLTIECNNHPTVYFEGKKTHAFYIPEIPENWLDQLNDRLILLQVLFHKGKKFYGWCKNLFSGKSHQSQEESIKTVLTHEIKTSWKESLDNLKKQLVNINKFAQDKIDLHWINNILEDRQEEFNHLNQLYEVTLEIITAFTENLQALDAELLEIRMNLDSTINKQYKTFKQRANNMNILAYKYFEHRSSSLHKKSNVLTARGFFNTQFFEENI